MRSKPFWQVKRFRGFFSKSFCGGKKRSKTSAAFAEEVTRQGQTTRLPYSLHRRTFILGRARRSLALLIRRFAETPARVHRRFRCAEGGHL
jgi:hypothetical protein